MGCRVMVTDGPQAIRLAVTGPVDRLDVAAVETATEVAMSDGRRVVVDLSEVGPASLQLLRALARIAGSADRQERVTLEGADRSTQQFLRARGLDQKVVLDGSG